MAFLPTTYRGKRRLKILLIVLCIFGTGVLGLHIWFVNNARGILKNIVEEKSKGKVKLELSQLRFNFFSNQLQIHQGDLRSTDTVTVPTSYHVKFSKLTLRVHSFWPLLLNKSLVLDSINILNPVIEVLQWKKDTTKNNSKEDLSVTQEMGRIYNSTLDVLKGFGIRRIIVNNASVSMVNKMKPESYPVWITNIYLNVLRKPGDENTQQATEQSVELTTRNQSIGLPGGRHHLSFKNFQLKLFGKRIELDSCTVTAVANGTSTSSYKIFFNKLMLVGVDFAAMSSLNLIRADSVYCENPLFYIKLNPSDAESKKKDKPDPEKIIRDLTSDLDLAFVGVKNAGIHLEIIGKKPRSIFNSNKDNFEMRGLRINGDSASPVHVERFDMLVRDYHLYNIDSSAIFGFDSIRFINDKIVLNNFSVHTTPSRLKIKSIRDFRFPRFELTGLDWYHLIFDQNVVAREAVLINPTIHYTKITGSTGKKTNFFSMLQNMDSLMTLERLNIINGELNLNFGKATSLSLYNVNLRVSSNELLQATNQEGLRKAVDYFSISKGLLKRKDLTGHLINVRYEPNNIIYADKLLINSTNNNVNASITDVFIDNMLLDERTEMIVADGLRWKNASVSLKTSTVKKADRKNMAGSFDINNILGSNTHLVLNNGITSINSSVQLLKVDALRKAENGPVETSGVHFAGNDLLIESDAKTIKANIEDIEVDNMLLKDEAKDIIADGVRWKNADIDINSILVSDSVKDNDGTLTVKNVAGSNTRVNISNNEGKIYSTVELVQAASLSKMGNEAFVAEGLLVKGNDLAIKGKFLQANVNSYQVASDESSFLSQLQVQKINGLDSLIVQSPRINFSADINSMLANDYHFMDVQAITPKINIDKWNLSEDDDTASTANTLLRIDKLSVTEPAINIATHHHDSVTVINIPGSKTSGITATEILIDKDGIQVGSMKVNTNAATLVKGGQTFGAENGNVNIDLSDVHLQKKEGKPFWGAVINNLTVKNPNSLILGKNKNKLSLEAASVGNLHLSSYNFADATLMFKDNPTAWVRTTNGQYADSNSVIKWYNAQYNNESKTLDLDSFSYHPLLSQDSAIARNQYQMDYTSFNAGAVNLTGIDLERLRSDTAMVASSIHLTNPVVKIFRDKFPPSMPSKHKPLPTVAIRNIARPVSIEKINITNGEVSYTEKQEKSRAEGTLLLKHISGTVENIKNKEHSASDSLAINLKADLMDQALIHLRIKQSYVDTANGFTLKLTMKPTELAVFNPVMVPLSNVKFTAGIVDSFQLNAIAKEYFAYGKMNMFYHDFHIKMISDGNPNKSGFKNNVVSFLANTFILKNNNTDREAVIFFKRMRDKSFFNYLLKITFNGMGTSVGAGKNRKNRRHYKNILEERGLPTEDVQLLMMEKP